MTAANKAITKQINEDDLKNFEPKQKDVENEEIDVENDAENEEANRNQKFQKLKKKFM